MRLRRLDLVRYGKFTDRSIDFGPKMEGTPDLHLVYGPNEAGKSTSISAWLDLLYGIEPRSSYNFLHDYSTMLIGAAVESEGALRELRRVKKNSASLRDELNAPLPESVVLGALGGIDRSAYRTMFSLDDDSLEEGGDAILASKGELGELLFSASAGLARLSEHLSILSGQADAFHKLHARNTELSRLKEELQKLRVERDAMDVAATRYASLIKDRDRAKHEYTNAQRQRDELQSELARGKALLSALPEWKACKRKKDELLTAPQFSDFPDAWTEKVVQLQRDESSLQRERIQIETAIKSLEEQLAGLSRDETLISLSTRVADAKIWRARFVTATTDLPSRREALEISASGVLELLSKLGRANSQPAELRLDSLAESKLRRLIESHSGVEARRDSAVEEHSTEVQRLTDLAAEIHENAIEATPQSDAWKTLQDCLIASQDSDHDTRHRLAVEAQEEAASHLQALLAGVAPWKGDWQTLENLPMPGLPQVEEIQRACAAADLKVTQAQDTITRLAAEHNRTVARIKALGQADGLLTDAEIGSLRTERETAWAEHRSTLTLSTAEVFEQSMRRDDLARDQRIAHADRLGSLRELVTDEAVNITEVQQAELAYQNARAEQSAAYAALTTHLKSIGLPHELSAEGLVAFTKARQRALEQLNNVRRHDSEIKAALEVGERHRADLLQMLRLCGISDTEDLSLSNLQRLAKTALERHAEALNIRGQFALQEKEVEIRAKRLKECLEAEANWKNEWTALCSKYWFGSSDGSLEAFEMGGLLDSLSALEEAERERIGLERRVFTMEEDQQQFYETVRLLMTEASRPTSSDPVADFDALDRAVSIAIERSNQLKNLEDQKIELHQQLNEHDARAQLYIEAARQILSHFGVDSLTAAAVAITKAHSARKEANELRGRISALLDTLEVTSLEEADSLLDSLNSDSLRQAVNSMEEQLSSLQTACEEFAVRFHAAEKAVKAVDADSAAAQIEEKRQTVLAQIRDGAERWLRVTLGTAAARRALAVYRDRHRSSMLEKASEAFATVSRNAYRGLTTQSSGAEELLVAIDSDGRSKVSDALSKGTRFQLYLALRVAGYHEFSKARTPMPFIADDIMETFDDFRAEEAFRLFANMASIGQVIYFTHHQHLVKIAQSVCPEVRLHDLVQV